ncbi:MAG TPA: PASTA domain-containing protein [Vicinamibacterales bacterium]|nr:PASTA domain-containing protein [Vicinamibacterales bacterium]
MALSARVWTAGKVLLLVGALATTFVIFAIVAARVAVRARDVSVPSLVGRTLPEATATASALELHLNVEDARRPDAQVPAEHVLGQEPPAGSSSRRQRSIRVWLSSGPRIARAPNLVGESQRAAEIRIVQDGLQAGPVAEIRSNVYPPDVVVAQDPSPGVQTGEVRLLVNRGEDRASYVMPDLIGVNGDRASDLLRSQGFRVSVTAQAAASGLPPGVVTRQSPPGGYQVHPGDAISIEVSP